MAESCPGEGLELAGRTSADIAHRLQNAAARRGDRPIVYAQRAAFVIIEPRRAEYGVRMTVDESGKHDAADLDDLSGRGGRLRTRTDPGDALAVDENSRIAQHFDIGHLAPASRACRTTAGDHLARADEKRLQSRFSRMGRRI